MVKNNGQGDVLCVNYRGIVIGLMDRKNVRRNLMIPHSFVKCAAMYCAAVTLDALIADVCYSFLRRIANSVV